MDYAFRNAPADLVAFVRHLTEQVTSGLTIKGDGDFITLHVRSGDVFSPLDFVPFAYVHPPASYHPRPSATRGPIGPMPPSR